MRLNAFVLVTLLSVLSFANSENVGDQCPEMIWSTETEPHQAPVWVSANRAIDAKGDLDWSVLGRRAQQRYETVLLREEVAARVQAESSSRDNQVPLTKGPDCLNLADSIAPMTGVYRGRTTAETLIREAAVVFHGRVSAIDHGFFLGRPGSLLRVVTEDQAKAHHSLDPFPFAFVFFFNGSFTAGNTSFCNEHSLFPYTPVVGDEITVISSLGGLGEDGRVFVADGFILFSSTEETLVSPILDSSSDLKAARTPYHVQQYVQSVLSTRADGVESGVD